jgi:hypothetical protein
MVNKQGALELSIGTIVVIVIGMSMLVLGLVLVRTIFTGSQESVESINEGVMQEIVNLFADEQGDLLVKLGSTNTAKIKPGDRFNVAIGARDPDGREVNRESLQYKVSFEDDSDDNCLSVLGEERTKSLFKTRVEEWHNFGRFSGSTAAELIEINVPEGTAICTQKVNVDLRTKDGERVVGGDFFILEIDKAGIF